MLGFHKGPLSSYRLRKGLKSYEVSACLGHDGSGVGAVADGSDVLHERVVLDGEVVGREWLAQALPVLEQFLKFRAKQILNLGSPKWRQH